MPFSVVLPRAGETPSSVKDGVVSTLAYERPLSVKSLHLAIQRRFGLDVTYQAVHKAVGELESEKVLVKGEKGYDFNSNWLHSLRSFTEAALQKTIQQHDFPSIFRPGNTHALFFNSISECDHFLIESANWLIPQAPDKCIYMYWNHGWTPLFFSKNEYQKVKEILENGELRVLLRNDTPLDRWVESVLGKTGRVQTRLGIQEPIPDFFVVGDYVLQVFYPKTMLEQLDLAYQNVQQIEQLDIEKLYSDVFEQKVGIPVIASHNPALAEELRQKVKSYFV